MSRWEDSITGTGQAFLLLETAATFFMSGVLWTRQLLNYPLLALVGTEAFPPARPLQPGTSSRLVSGERYRAMDGHEVFTP